MSVKAETQKIEFTGTLNMNKNQTDVKQFAGFNTKNSPVFGGCLSPFYTKSVTKSGVYQITRNGDVYRAYNGNLYKNGVSVLAYDMTYLSKEKFTMPDGCFNASCDLSDKMFYLILDSNNNIKIQYGTDIVDTGLQAAEITCSAIHLHYNSTTASYHFLCALNYKALDSTIGSLTYIDFITSGTIYKTATITTGGYGLYNYISINTDKNDVPVICNAANKGAHIKVNATGSIYNYIYNGTTLISKNAITYANDGTTSTGYNELPIMLETGIWVNGPFDIDSVLALGNSTKIYFRSSSFYYDSSTDKIIIVAAQYPYLYADQTGTVSLYKTYDLYNYYERSMNVSPVAYSSKYENTLYDNSRPSVITAGAGYVNYNSYVYNNTGSRIQLTKSDHSTLSKFRILINNGYPSGISVGDDGYYGVLVTDWNTIDDVFRPVTGSDFIIYKNSSDNTYYKIICSSGNDIELNYYFDRYIVINTSGRMNCYDTKTGKILNYSTDFNSNIPLGGMNTNFDVGSVTYSSNTTYIYAQGKNANYELSDNTNTCWQINPIICINAYNKVANTTYLDLLDANDGQYIDFYITSGSTATAAEYYSSYYRKSINSIIIYRSNFERVELKGAEFPITSSGNMIYNANIFTKIIKSYISQDMAITDGTAYPVIYSDNSKAVPAYYLLSGCYGLNNIFVIQGQTYGLSDNQIFTLTFSEGTLTNATAIVDISSYTYISANPRMAIFWSPLNKSVYVFTGDRLLTRLYEANKITTIYGSYYNPANYAIYISTDAGLYVITDDNIYCIDQTDISNMFFCEDSFIIENSANLIYYKYVTDTGYVSEGIKLATAYYGMGNNGVSVIDTWYIRLYNNGTAESGTLKVSVNSLTDIGRESETKTFTIKATDWDSETGTFYIRYQPKYQRGIGLQLTLETDFPIADMSCSVSSGGELQVAHNNI